LYNLNFFSNRPKYKILKQPPLTLWIRLEIIYLVETENFLLKVL